MKRPHPKFDERMSALEAADAKKWNCDSCGAPIDPEREDVHCWACASYWEDVANGLWDDPL